MHHYLIFIKKSPPLNKLAHPQKPVYAGAMRIFCFFLFLASGLFLRAGDESGAIASLNALSSSYRDGVLKLSADNADPNPDTWYVAAQKDGDDSNIHNITVADGQVTSDKRTLGFREIFSQASPVSLDKVTVDSREAFEIAQNYAKANGRMLGSVSFVLQQKGASAAPVWSVWCYGPDGSYLGLMQMLATNGTVISNDAFPKKP